MTSSEKLSGIKNWLRAIRAPFFTATIIPISLGAIVAWYDGVSFNWLKFWLTLIGGLLIHCGTNLANDYFDHISGCDEVNPNPTPFSGGSRVIQEGIIPAEKILYVAVAAFIIGAKIGLYLNSLSGTNVILILGIIGVFLGFFYTAKPFRIGYGTLGELAVAVGFGPLMVLGAYYVQAQSLSLRVFMVSLPVGILVALILFINEFPDYTADKSVGKNTLVVALGKKKAITLYHILLATVYLWLISLFFLKMIPYLCLIVFLSLPMAIKAFQVSQKNFDKVYELLPANAFTIKLHFSIGLLLCVGFILGKII